MPVRPRPSVYLVPAMLCWGLGTVLTKYALSGFTPLSLLPVQLLTSVTFLGAALAVRRERPRLTTKNRRAAALGVLNPGIAYALGLVGLARIDASVSLVLWATEPLLIVVLAFLLLKERISLRNALLLALAMTGVLLIVGAPSGAAPFIGVVLTLAAVTACALYSVLLRRMRLTDGSVPIVFLQQMIALAFALSIFALSAAAGPAFTSMPRPLEIAAAVGAGVLYYGAAFSLYVAGLRLTSATRAGMYLTLIPVFGLAFSRLLLDEHLDGVQVAGALMVITAIGALSRAQAASEV